MITFGKVEVRFCCVEEGMGRKEVNAVFVGSAGTEEIHSKLVNGSDGSRNLTPCKQTWYKLLLGVEEMRSCPWAGHKTS